jgi:hypothetical protein
MDNLSGNIPRQIEVFLEESQEVSKSDDMYRSLPATPALRCRSPEVPSDYEEQQALKMLGWKARPWIRKLLGRVCSYRGHSYQLAGVDLLIQNRSRWIDHVCHRCGDTRWTQQQG